MGKTVGLDGEDRAFLADLARFAYSNPFGDENAAALARLVPQADASDRSGASDLMAGRLAARIDRLDATGPARLGHFPPEDRDLVEAGFLYRVYHRYIESFDRLIERQATAGAPVAVRFASEALASLSARGFDDRECERYFGFFYQLRRAFYFIVHSLAGESPGMRGLKHALWNNVFTHDMGEYRRRLWNRMEDFSTLLLGETGTGKGNAAAAIGRSGYIPFISGRGRFSASFNGTFIALNLSQYPETLIESELFGHRKGAFTGAVEDHRGVLERCSEHGALFLDEIGEVGVPVQIKLLQVLQDRSFAPLGGHDVRRFAGRVIAATNRTVDELRGTGTFRDDFFYRLCSDVIVVPALRERIAEAPDELARLVGNLVERAVGEPAAELSAKVLACIDRDLPTGYGWPGNVRELEQAVRRVLLTGSYRGAALPAGGDEPEVGARFLERVRAGELSADELLTGYCSLLYSRSPVYTEVARQTGLDRRTVRDRIRRGWEG